MTRFSLISASILLAGLLALGCDKGKDAAAGDGKTGAAASEEKSGDSAAGDVQKVCMKMCDKAVECAAELGKEIAKSLGDGPEAKKAVEEAEKGAKEGLEECKQGCKTEKVTAEDKVQIEQAKKCVEMSDCGKFMECMEKIGSK